MGQVTLTLNGRSYRLACGEGEEERLQGLCGHLRGHVDKIKGDFGQIGDERLLLMAALMVTDELWEARECLAAAETALKSLRPAAARSPESDPQPLPDQEVGADPAKVDRHGAAGEKSPNGPPGAGRESGQGGKSVKGEKPAGDPATPEAAGKKQLPSLAAAALGKSG